MFFINIDSPAKDRYDISKLVKYENGCYDLLDSYFVYLLKKLPHSGIYRVQKEENRPDLLSYSIYGDTQYWWILLLYNDLAGAKDLTNGLVIKYPSLSDLEEIYMRLLAIERSKENIG